MILSHCMSKLFLLDGILKESRCSPASFIPLRISWTIAEWLSCNGRVTKKGSQEICYVYGWWNMSHYMVSSVMLASQKKSKYVKIGYPFGKHYIQIFPLPVIFHCQVWLPEASKHGMINKKQARNWHGMVKLFGSFHTWHWQDQRLWNQALDSQISLVLLVGVISLPQWLNRP